MTPGLRVMLLIDADNVATDVIEQAVQRTLAEHGAIHVRRAYCTAEMALRQQALFKRLQVRPMVNLSAGKNSTDIALAVDALDLVLAERPDVVVLVSSDSDFAPLVIRLREKGCHVCGIGQAGKTGEETRGAYDEFVDLVHTSGSAPRPAPAAKAASSAPARKSAAPARKASAKAAAKTVAVKAPAKAAAKAVAKKAAVRASGGRASTPASASAPAQAGAAAAREAAVPAPASAHTAEDILNAVPALRAGKEVPLNDVVKALRAGHLLGKNASSSKLFEKHPAAFKVSEHRVRWMGVAAS